MDGLRRPLPPTPHAARSAPVAHEASVRTASARSPGLLRAGLLGGCSWAQGLAHPSPCQAGHGKGGPLKGRPRLPWRQLQAGAGCWARRRRAPWRAGRPEAGGGAPGPAFGGQHPDAQVSNTAPHPTVPSPTLPKLPGIQISHFKRGGGAAGCTLWGEGWGAHHTGCSPPGSGKEVSAVVCATTRPSHNPLPSRAGGPWAAGTITQRPCPHKAKSHWALWLQTLLALQQPHGPGGSPHPQTHTGISSGGGLQQPWPRLGATGQWS